MRRLVHLVLLISLIAVVRACGGLVVAEDRISAHTQWIGEKTGVTTLRRKWQEDISPPINAAGRRAWVSMEQATLRALERLASGLGNVGSAAGAGMGRATSRPDTQRKESPTGGADAPPARSNESSEPGALAP